MPLLYKAVEYSSVLGIDVASEKLDLYWSDSQQSRYEQIAYTNEALDKFIKANSQIMANSCLVGMESTGDYQLFAAKYFLNKGFEVKIINPLLTKQHIRTTIRGIKTDKKDAELINKLLREGHGETVNLAVLSNKRKELLRLSDMLTKTAVRLKLRLYGTERKAINGTEVIEKKLAKIIKSIEDFSDELVSEATVNQLPEEKLIDSIPGFATKLSAVVNQELGNIDRFKNSKSLVAYAGLDPRIKQSGKSLNTTGRITKRGSSYLRAALYLAANVARQYDKELGAYYLKKKTEGRKHKEILCMLGRKLLYRIYAVLKEKREYARH